MFYKIKVRDVKMLKKYSITTRIYAVTYYQTLEEVRWLLRVETKKIKRLEKMKFYQKIA